MPSLPCSSRLDVFDAVRFGDEAARAAALPVAVQLCAGCPAKCPEQVTAAGVPRESAVRRLPVVTGLIRCRVTSVRALPERQLARRRDGRWLSDAAQRCRDHVAEAARLAAEGQSVRDIAARLQLTPQAAAALVRLANTLTTA